MTQAQLVLAALLRHKRITAEALRRETGVQNVSNAVVRLRGKGHVINCIVNQLGTFYEYITK